MYYVEVRPTLRRNGKPRLVPLTDAYNYRGFRSVFAFDEATKDLIELNGSTSNLRGIDVFANTLFFDFDHGYPDEFMAYLKQSGLKFTEWNSGGRSTHIHLSLLPCYGFWVPSACKNWTKIHAPTADTSFLHATGMYRLPHTFHAKYPGRRKEQTYEQDGTLLELHQPVGQTVYRPLAVSTPDQFYFLLTANKGPGNRSAHIWLLATTAAECGMEVEEALDAIRSWNSRQSAPQTDAVIIRQTETAYTRAERNAK